MIRRTVGFLTVVALLMTMMLTTAMRAMAERPDDKGQPGAEEDKIAGSPGDPNAWGERSPPTELVAQSTISARTPLIQ